MYIKMQSIRGKIWQIIRVKMFKWTIFSIKYRCKLLWKLDSEDGSYSSPFALRTFIKKLQSKWSSSAFGKYSICFSPLLTVFRKTFMSLFVFVIVVFAFWLCINSSIFSWLFLLLFYSAFSHSILPFGPFVSSEISSG
jgi:hypothetical protein